MHACTCVPLHSFACRDLSGALARVCACTNCCPQESLSMGGVEREQRRKGPSASRRLSRQEVFCRVGCSKGERVPSGRRVAPAIMQAAVVSHPPAPESPMLYRREVKEAKAHASAQERRRRRSAGSSARVCMYITGELAREKERKTGKMGPTDSSSSQRARKRGKHAGRVYYYTVAECARAWCLRLTMVAFCQRKYEFR